MDFHSHYTAYVSKETSYKTSQHRILGIGEAHTNFVRNATKKLLEVVEEPRQARVCTVSSIEPSGPSEAIYRECWLSWGCRVEFRERILHLLKLVTHVRKQARAESKGYSRLEHPFKQAPRRSFSDHHGSLRHSVEPYII